MKNCKIQYVFRPEYGNGGFKKYTLHIKPLLLYSGQNTYT